MLWSKPSVVETCVGMEVTGYESSDELPHEIQQLQFDAAADQRDPAE